MNTTLVALFHYKAWANTELHAALESFDAEKHPGKFHAMLATLDHAHVVDRIFQGHLAGLGPPAFRATQSSPVPSLASCARPSGRRTPGISAS